MTNSMHAMPNGGTIVVETSLAPPPADEPGDWVVLSLRDTGVGMDEETLAHIFDPFYTTRKDGKGTGLGLSIVYGIVRQTNGHLRVESQPGVGTTFRIWWQQARNEQGGRGAAAVEASTRAVQKTPETVLLVEDREEVRNLMTAILGKSGYRILAAADAEEAIETAASHPGEIDLLLTDVVMPGMNGRELAERLVAADPELKVILMSGFAAEVIKPGSTRHAGFAFLQKPVTADALTAKVREILATGLVTA
jgi:CheY-like chemotaxis protein